MGLYVYAIAGADAGKMPVLCGLLEQPIYRVANGELVAIVSDCRLGAVRPERKHIAASQRVLGALNGHFDLLPMAFGTVSQSRQLLEAFLGDHRDDLGAMLRRIAGSVEMGLRLSLDVADPIARLVERTPELEAARERVFGGRRAASHNDRIRLGQLCESALQRYREAETAQVVAMIAPSCTEVMTMPARGEKELANLAMLVPRSGVERFQSAVADAAAQFDDDYAFSISGPWPPHNFVQLQLHRP